MSRVTQLARGMAALALGVAMAACSDAGAKAAPVGDLARDLQEAQLELRPTGAGTDFVGALEQTPLATKAPAAPRAREVQRKTPRQAPRPQVRSTPSLASMPSPQPVQEQPSFEPIPAATRPVQASSPAISPPPPGGYKSVNEVMRNAPFPINP